MPCTAFHVLYLEKKVIKKNTYGDNELLQSEGHISSLGRWIGGTCSHCFHASGILKDGSRGRLGGYDPYWKMLAPYFPVWNRRGGGTSWGLEKIKAEKQRGFNQQEGQVKCPSITYFQNKKHISIIVSLCHQWYHFQLHCQCF